MAEIIKNVTEGLSLTYIKYKKYTTERAKNRVEKTSDQYEAVSKSNLRFMPLEWSNGPSNKGQNCT